MTTSINAVRVTTTDKTSIYFKTINATALVNGQSADTAQAVRAGVAYDHNVSSRLFVNMFNDWEYDRFQNLDLRFVVGGGLGFHAVKTERSRLDLLAGFDYNHSKFSTPLTRNSGEVFWGDEYNLKLSSLDFVRPDLSHVQQSERPGGVPCERRHWSVNQAVEAA